MLNSRCCFAEDGTDLFKIACRTRSTLIFSHSTYQILSLCRCRSCCRLQRSSSLSSYHWPSSRVPQLHSKAAGIVLCIVALLQYLQPHICQSPEKHRARKVKSFQSSNLLTSSACPRNWWRNHWNACKLSIGSLSMQRFWATNGNRKWTFCRPGHWSLPDFQTNRLY